MTAKTILQIEFDAIDAILSTLWQEGLLTDIECRIIAKKDAVHWRREAIYLLIMSKSKDEAAVLTERFRIMNEAIHSEEQPITLESANNNEVTNSVLPSRNPFMNNTIIKHLFGFLTLEDLKQSRLVCRQWNSTAEICLRKRAAIEFSNIGGLRPEVFILFSKYYSCSLPFSSFRFFSYENSGSWWQISQIKEFMKEWETDLKEVMFLATTIILEETFTFRKATQYDVTELFSNPSNITSLTITYLDNYRDNTLLSISLEKFVSIKNLRIYGGGINNPAEGQSTRSAPLNISFLNIKCMQNGEILADFYFNDLIDFSQALNILVQINLKETNEIFDLGRQVFKADQLHLLAVSLENWSQAKGDVQFLRLGYIPFIEKNDLQIKVLSFCNSVIDLAVLPQTLEILKLSEGNLTEIICTAPFFLPNLKFLMINATDHDRLVAFSNCPELIDLEIEDDSPTQPPYIFSLGCVPKTVKRMTIHCFQLEFADKDCVFELETLTLVAKGDDPRLTDCATIISQIKAQVLIVVCGKDMNVNTSAIPKLVLANNQSRKIIIGSYSDWYAETPFEGSDLSKCVDEKSNYYQFENGVGTSITEQEFNQLYIKADKYIPKNFFED